MSNSLVKGGPWKYVLVFDESVGTRDFVKQTLNAMPEVLDWYTCMPSCFFFLSTLTANQFATRFRQVTATSGRFFVSDLALDKDGFLPEGAWIWINKPLP